MELFILIDSIGLFWQIQCIDLMILIVWMLLFKNKNYIFVIQMENKRSDFSSVSYF